MAGPSFHWQKQGQQWLKMMKVSFFFVVLSSYRGFDEELTLELDYIRYGMLNTALKSQIIVLLHHGGSVAVALPSLGKLSSSWNKRYAGISVAEMN